VQHGRISQSLLSKRRHNGTDRRLYSARTVGGSALCRLAVQFWPIDRFVLCARNPRKNDVAVDRMCSGIREFGFKIPVLAGSDGAVVDGHLRLKGARKLGSSAAENNANSPAMSAPRKPHHFLGEDSW